MQRDAGDVRFGVGAEGHEAWAGESPYGGRFLGPAGEAFVEGDPLLILSRLAQDHARVRRRVDRIDPGAFEHRGVRAAERRPAGADERGDAVGPRGELKSRDGTESAAPPREARKAGGIGDFKQIGAHAIDREFRRRNGAAASEARIIRDEHAVPVGEPGQKPRTRRRPAHARDRVRRRGDRKAEEEQRTCTAVHLKVDARSRRAGGDSRRRAVCAHASAPSGARRLRST